MRVQHAYLTTLQDAAAFRRFVKIRFCLHSTSALSALEGFSDRYAIKVNELELTLTFTAKMNSAREH